MAEKIEAWDQQPNESNQAYAAFRIYLELGHSRALVTAYRKATGKPNVEQASGRWHTWAKVHRWAE
ncbi:hypothetical protein ACYOEI_40430, partial [Singulisphaera rosea]